jgi:glycosyltransferase involved in cell wall biosynthesis
MNDPAPDVSVLLITYNHAKFVAQALDSVLMQQADFDFEVVAADDGSTDGTFAIIKKYAERDSRIRVLSSDSNAGISRNYQRGFAACRGEFVAVLEGDDYWMSPRKLDLTAEFLRRNPTCSFCFHRIIRYDPYPETVMLFPPQWTVEQQLTVRELAKGNFVGGFSTCVYRRKIIEALPSTLWRLDIREWFFNIVVAEHGPIGYLPQILSIYRAHEGGIWSMKSNAEHTSELRRLIECYDKFLDYRFTHELQHSIAPPPAGLAGARRMLFYWRVRIWVAQRLPGSLKDKLRKFIIG